MVPSREEIENIQVNDNEIREIIGIIPSWFVRYGIACIFIFLLIMLVGCWVFKYPDIISGKVEITVSNIPASIVSKTNGRIEKIFIADNQQVSKDQPLAVIENPANYSNILNMLNIISPIDSFFQNENAVLPELSITTLQLGEIQSSYSTFVKRYSDYKNFIALDYHQTKIDAVNFEIKQQEEYLQKLKLKFGLSKEQLAISKTQFKRDSQLYSNRVIALADYEKAQNQYLQNKSSFESSNTDVLLTKIQITKLKQSILDLQSQKLEQNTQQKNSLKESYELLLASYEEWKKTYLLKSPVDGTITFTQIWKVNQNIKPNDVVFTVIPQNSKNYIAKIQVPINSSGKIKIGQKAIIKLDDYPYMEYGLLFGYINKVSLIPNNDIYIAEVIFPSKLITSYGKDISVRNELKGNCEIVTKNQRLIYKFVNPIKALWDKNKLE